MAQHNAVGRPVFLAHDGQQMDRVKNITLRYNATVVNYHEFLTPPFIQSIPPSGSAEHFLFGDDPGFALFVDLLMLGLASSYRGSTMSFNVAHTSARPSHPTHPSTTFNRTRERSLGVNV